MKKGEEYELQKECVDWFRTTYPNYLLFSVPNEACWKNKNYFAGLGSLSGVSDTIVVLPNQVIFPEFKSKTGRQSIEQKQFQQKIEELGFKYYIIRNLNYFKYIIKMTENTNSPFKWFKYSEMTKSETAKKQGIDNTPTDDVVIANIMYTLRCLDTIRDLFGQPIIITSGYRSYDLNRAVRGAKTSQHVQGEAADFITKGKKTNKDLYEFIRDHCMYDQLIAEKIDKKGNPQWIHCSFLNDYTANRREALIFKNGRYMKDPNKAKI